MKRAAVALLFGVLSCNYDDSSGQNGPLGGDPNDPNNPNAPPGPGMMFGKTNVGGTRLKAKVLVGPDGSKNYPGMYDTMLKMDCAYGWAQDRKLRCLPANQYAEPYPDVRTYLDRLGNSTTVHADSACKGGVVVWTPKSFWTMGYMSELRGIDTGMPLPDTLTRKWFRLTEVTPAPDAVYLRTPNGSCFRTPLTTDEFNGERFYTVDFKAPAPPTDFVEVADVKLE